MKLPKKRVKDWPKSCLESWVKTLTRWDEKGEDKLVKASSISTLRHTLEVNLAYIEELENKGEHLWYVL